MNCAMNYSKILVNFTCKRKMMKQLLKFWINPNIFLGFCLLIFATGYPLLALAAEYSYEDQLLCKSLMGNQYAGVIRGFNKYFYDSSQNLNGYHPGVDCVARRGDIAYSPIKGYVAAKNRGGLSAYGAVSIKIDGTNDYFFFAHLGYIYVNEGDRINIGSKIGSVGLVGTNNYHLHVEVREGRSLYLSPYFSSSKNTGVNKDPTLFIPKTSNNYTYSKTPSKLYIYGSTSLNESSSTSYTAKVYYTDGSNKDVTNNVSWSEDSQYAYFSGSRLSANSVSYDQSFYVRASYSENGKTVATSVRVTIKDSYSSGSSSNSSSSSSSTSASKIIDNLYNQYRSSLGYKKGGIYTSGAYTYQNFSSGINIKVEKSGSYYYIYYYNGRTWVYFNYVRA